MQMDYRRLGRSSLYVSRIGLGCVTFGREINQEMAFRVMDHAISRGINFFDTAEAYSGGQSEEVVGSWIKARGIRKQVLLATKVAGNLTRDRVLTSCDASLRRLKTDYIDLFQLHHFDGENPQEPALEAMDILVRQGKVVSLGCSNHAAWQLCKALWIQDVNKWQRFESDQECYNLAIREIDKQTIPLVNNQGLGLVGYSPLGAGFLTGKYGRNRLIPAGTRFDVVKGHSDPYFSEGAFSIVEALKVKAANLDVSLIGLALAWVLCNPSITSMLIGAREVTHVDQAFDALEYTMNPELRNELTGILPM